MEQNRGEQLSPAPPTRPLLDHNWTSSAPTPGHEHDRDLSAKYAKGESEEDSKHPTGGGDGTIPPKWVSLFWFWFSGV
jgi:hypothetical protein